MSSNALKEMSDRLWREPSTKNWEAFAKSLKGSGARYYKPVFESGKIKKFEDLRRSWVIIYDSKYKIITKVPIFMNRGKGLVGATKYLIGLSVINGL